MPWRDALSHLWPNLIVGKLWIGLPRLTSAHTSAGVAGGVVSGFFHPLTGLDYVAIGGWCSLVHTGGAP
jgi:hydrogenase/urease accessory protein HupE